MVCHHFRLWLTVNDVRAMTRKIIHCLSRESSALKFNFRKATPKYPSCKVSGNRGVSLLQVASEVGKHPFQPILPPQLNCNHLRLGSGAWLKGANKSKVLGSPLRCSTQREQRILQCQALFGHMEEALEVRREALGKQVRKYMS